MLSSSYTLSASFFQHHKAVRTLSLHGNILISGSIDSTCQLFLRMPPEPSFHHHSAITLFEDYIYAVLIRPDQKGFLIGCKDHKIYVLDNETNPIGILEGHTDAISSLSMEGNILISGSWDTTARVWDVSSGSLVKTLPGHSFAVAVLVFKSQIITGSQDGILHFWSLETGEKVRSIQKAHNDIIREIAKVESISAIVSCSNDETFKLWTLEGVLLQNFQGHESYVFSVKSFELGMFITASDDRTVKLWEQAAGCIQTIEHPNTVWHVEVDPETSDIITACADGVIRVFTKDPARLAPESELKEFEKSIESTRAQNNQGLAPGELEKLPSITAQSQFQGKKDGEIRLFRNGIAAEAYVWKAEAGGWEKIGDVISGNQRKYFEGDRYFQAGEYDYVFDVDIQGSNPSRLPYNEGDNPLETADKFLAREGLGKGHIEQITNFIKQNTKGIHKKAAQSVQNQVSKPVNKKEEFSFFPTPQYLSFEGMNQQGIMKKTMESNEVLKSQGSKLAMSEKEAKYFIDILEVLSNVNQYYSSQLTPFTLDFFRNKLLNWPLEVKIYVFDILRVYLLHPQSEVLFSGLNAGLDILTDICSVLHGKAGENEPLIALCLKVLSNMFIQVTNQNSMLKNASLVFDGINRVLTTYSQKPKIMDAVSNLVFNYSIALALNFEIKEEEVLRFGDILASFVTITALTNNSQCFRGLIGVGNLLVCPKKRYIEMIRSKVSGVIKALKLGVTDGDRDKTDACWKEVLQML